MSFQPCRLSPWLFGNGVRSSPRFPSSRSDANSGADASAGCRNLGIGERNRSLEHEDASTRPAAGSAACVSRLSLEKRFQQLLAENGRALVRLAASYSSS